MSSISHSERNVLREIQEQIGRWAQEQFGDNVSKWNGHPYGSLMPLLGIVEEVGELVHPVLYRHQGRGFTNQQEYEEAVEDSLADMLVFMSDFACREGFKLDELLIKVWTKVQKRRQASWLADKAAENCTPSEALVPQRASENTLTWVKSVHPAWLNEGQREDDPRDICACGCKRAVHTGMLGSCNENGCPCTGFLLFQRYEEPTTTILESVPGPQPSNQIQLAGVERCTCGHIEGLHNYRGGQCSAVHCLCRSFVDGGGVTPLKTE